MRNKRKINPLKWIGYLFTPIQKNGAFFVFMFALGWICTQHEIMPYYLRNKGAEPYELSMPELFLDIYVRGEVGGGVPAGCLRPVAGTRLRAVVKIVVGIAGAAVVIASGLLRVRFCQRLAVTGARNQRNYEKQPEQWGAKIGNTTKIFKQRIAHDDKNKKTRRLSPVLP